MVGFRTRHYYKELKKIPNVRLIPAAQKSLNLIKNSELVITLLGTAGWEAALLKKPVIIFGDIYYDCLSAVKRCRAIEELPSLVQMQLTAFRYDEQQIVHFIAALFRESFELDLVSLWDVEGGRRITERRAELITLVDRFAEKLALNRV